MKNLRQLICKVCGSSFDGGPHSYYCPTCRGERRRVQNAARHKKNRNLNVSNKKVNESEKEKIITKSIEKKYNLARIAREVGKDRSSVNYAYKHGKLPDPDGYSSLGFPFWFPESIENYLSENIKTESDKESANMKLDEWLASGIFTQSELARSVGLSRAAVNFRIKQGALPNYDGTNCWGPETAKIVAAAYRTTE